MGRPRLLEKRSLLLAALLLSIAAQARTFQGFVTHVSDGDSLWVRTAEGGAPREVRLQGIDAPEICQASGPQARAALESVALRRTVVVQTRARDRYERIVGRVYVDSHDLGAWLVARGGTRGRMAGAGVAVPMRGSRPPRTRRGSASGPPRRPCRRASSGGATAPATEGARARYHWRMHLRFLPRRP